MRRRSFIATTAGLGTALLAGCSGGGDSDGPDGGGGDSGTFRLLISDQPAAIEDFDSLDVTLSSARVFRADDDETVTSAAVTGTTAERSETEETTADETDGDENGFVEFDLEDETVDLTQVVGDRAISVLEGELAAGRYSGIELSVSDAEGVVDGDAVEVTVPSNRLRIVKPFEVAADEELGFVFDIRVVQRGPDGGYNLLPVIGESGVAGVDIDVEEVGPDAGDGTETAGGDGGSDNQPDDAGN